MKPVGWMLLPLAPPALALGLALLGLGKLGRVLTEWSLFMVSRFSKERS